MPPARQEAVDLMAEWDFIPTEELPGGHCSYVFTDGPRVFKFPHQGEERTTGRIAAVRMSGNGGVRVHRADEATGALLMDRLMPGIALGDHGLDDAFCLPIFRDLAMSLKDIDVDGLAGLDTYLDTDLPFVRRMLQTSPPGRFLHGDLHHFNILLGDQGWTAIDPKGLIGDPAFESAAFLRNPFDDFDKVADFPGFVAQRIHDLAHALQVDPARVWGWGLADRLSSDDADEAPWGRLKKALEDLTSLFSRP